LDFVRRPTDTLKNGTRLEYGFGLERTRVRGHDAIMHGGSTQGFISGGFIFPQDSINIVLLTNSSVSPSALALNIVSALFTTPNAATSRARVAVPMAQPLTDADRDRVLGVYDVALSSGGTLVVRVALDQDTLVAHLEGAGQRALPLVHRGNLRFATPAARGTTLAFIDENGKITSLRFQQNGATSVGTRRP
jgi:hypothetical protein